MSKRKTTTGSQSLKRRGLVGLLVPVTPEVRDMVQRAAAVGGPVPQRSSAWAAQALERAAREALATPSGLPRKNS